MPNLADLTDNAIPQQDAALPVEQPYRGVNLGPLQGANSGTIGNTDVAVAPATPPAVVQALPMPVIPADPQAFSPDTSSVGSTIDQIVNKLTGANGVERYQTWPEKVVREALAAPHDVMTGDIPQYSVDPDTGDVHTSPQMIAGAQAVSALAGGGGVAGVEEGADAALGATPFLRPALKYGDKIYKAPVNGQHLDALPAHLADTFQKQALSGEDISNFNFGFMNHKGQFLDREKALDYAVKEGLVDPSAGQYGALTSTLLADSSKPGTAIEAMAKTGSPFYSALEHNVNQIGQSKMTGDQWLGTLANKPGVKPEEMDWTGVKSFLEERGNQPVTKAELQEHLQNNKVELKEVVKGAPIDEVAKAKALAESHGHVWDNLSNVDKNRYTQIANGRKLTENPPTKYHSYQLPGGENYREMLMTLPKNDNALNARMTAIEDQLKNSNLSKTEIDSLRQEYKSLSSKSGDSDIYKSSHWDEPNILAHVRMNDRTIDGKKSLHLEEIQSDWHQQGREKGYQGKDTYESKRAELTSKMNEIRKTAPSDPNDGMVQLKWLSEHPEYEKLRREFNSLVPDSSGNNAVPDAPFKKTWHELALKRMIREAAEKGYDRLSWTPGEAQAARYDLSKSVSTVVYKDGKLTAIGPTGQHVINDQVVGKDKLADYIGKEAAEKLLKQEPHNGAQALQGEQLKIGGEGMKGFYDQIIPKALSKISGEKVKTGGVNPVYHLIDNEGKPGQSFANKAEGEAWLKRNPDSAKFWSLKENAEPVHYIDLPQSLKDKAMQKGFPLFSGNYMYTPVSGNPFEKKKKK